PVVSRLAVATAAILMTLTSAGFAEQQTITLTKRSRVENPDGQWEIVEAREQWDAKKTAVIVCDMWDAHHCLNATQRGAELAPRMNRVLDEARQRGALIVHAPSSCVKFYADHPARKRAQQAPAADNVPKDIDQWCNWKDATEEKIGYPIDHSDGGEDDDPQEHEAWHAKLKSMGRYPKAPWIRQVETLKIDPELDAISDSGVEIWNLLEQRGIQNVILVGVHTNMCVLGRPFGLRQMARNGKNVVLMRDLTDTMYNPKSWPYVSHFQGTDLVVEHVEKHVCPTVTSDQLLGGAAFHFKNDPRPHIVFMIGEKEYSTKKTLPAFAQDELNVRGFRTTFIHAGDEDGNDFPGLEAALQDADLLVISVRRRTPKQSQLKPVRDYVQSGRPIVGIRTASHAFAADLPSDAYAAWPDFDNEVLGGDYQGHHGNKPPQAPYTLVQVTDEGKAHPIMQGVPNDEFRVTSHLYRNLDMAATSVILMKGRVDGRDNTNEPASWTNDRKGQRVFYTCLGDVNDFRVPAFRQMLLNAVCWALDRPVPDKAQTARPQSGA
ncbi:MAG: ThuA domain-containing protein, partial [Pirellulales bacterium]